MNRRLLVFPLRIILLALLSVLSLSAAIQGLQPIASTLAPSAAEPSPTALAPGANGHATTDTNIIAAPASCTGSSCTIISTTGWQQTPLTLQQGATFSILYTNGTWTVDKINFEKVGPDGYPSNRDSQIGAGCKVDESLPYARLLGQIGSGSAFSIGGGGTFTANASGVLALRINDLDNCLPDNDGSIVLQAQAGINCANVTEIPSTECNALVTLYNSTNGPNWLDHTGWLSTLTPCSWFGVNCLNNHVYFLNLTDNQLSGALPSQIGDFPEMLAIYMANNQLNGNIPTQLSNLTKLIDLNLSHNQLSGGFQRN